jgi:hypothetical protein
MKMVSTSSSDFGEVDPKVSLLRQTNYEECEKWKSKNMNRE